VAGGGAGAKVEVERGQQGGVSPPMERSPMVPTPPGARVYGPVPPMTLPVMVPMPALARVPPLEGDVAGSGWAEPATLAATKRAGVDRRAAGIAVGNRRGFG